MTAKSQSPKKTKGKPKKEMSLWERAMSRL